MEEIRGPAGRTMWDKLGNVHEAVLANYLKNEYPQTVAVVLSKVQPDHAARVLTMLPDSFAMEVVMRMLRMESVQKDVLDGVERTLRAEFMSNLARSTRRDAHEMMAEIFNNLDRQAETRFLAALEERNREAAERIKSLMFTFDDLQRLTGPAMQTLLRARREGQAAAGAEGRVGEAARPVLRQPFRARRQDAARGNRGAGSGEAARRRRGAGRASWRLAKELAAQGQIEIAENKDEELVLLTLAWTPPPSGRPPDTGSADAPAVRHPVRRGFRRLAWRHRARRAAEDPNCRAAAAAGYHRGRRRLRRAPTPMPRATRNGLAQAAADRAEVTRPDARHDRRPAATAPRAEAARVAEESRRRGGAAAAGHAGDHAAGRCARAMAPPR